MQLGPKGDRHQQGMRFPPPLWPCRTAPPCAPHQACQYAMCACCTRCHKMERYCASLGMAAA